MRWPEFLICAAFFITRCSLFFNCCEGRPSFVLSTSPSVAQSSVDCGSLQSPVKPTVQSEMPSISSLLRNNFFPSTFQRLYTCWSSSDVTEVYHYRDTCALTRKVTVQFNDVDVGALENMKGAILTLTVVYPDGMDDDSRDQFGPLQVLGTASGLDGVPQRLALLTEENPVANVKNQEVLNFDALNLLRDTAYQHQQKKNKLAAENQKQDFGNDETGNEKITLKFFVSRSCDNLVVYNCPKLLDTAVHKPSLRIFYVVNEFHDY